MDADILVQPSRYEQAAWAPIEAVLCGTPVIVSENSGSGEDISRIQAGYLVNYGDRKQLVRTIERVLENPAESKEMVRRAQQYIRTNLSLDKKVEEYKDLYRQCIEEARYFKEGQMRILITGGAGFIGSHLCDKFINEGHTVLCFDNFFNGSLVNIRHLLNHKTFKLINGDVRSFDTLEKFVPGVDVIYHLAAQIHVDRSIIEPKMTYDVNVLGTQNVLEAARMYDVEKVVHMSTSEVYGSAEKVPMDENHPLNAPHPYGASKIAADRMCHAYNQTYKMNITIARPFNAFGPRQKDTGYGGVISIYCKRVMNGQPPIIYGDGQQTRDYNYVADLVEALGLIIKQKQPISEPVNIGTGKEIKIIDLANLIIDLFGQTGHLKPVFVEPRPGEVQRLIADSSKAKKLLGWSPKYSFKEGLNQLIDWYKNYKSEEWSKPG